jgi:hypothetical protein
VQFITRACSFVASGERVKTQQVDLSLQSAYGIAGASPKNIYETVCQYYEIDWVCEFFVQAFCVRNAKLVRNASLSFVDLFILLIIAMAHLLDAQVRELSHVLDCDSHFLVLGPRPEFMDSISLGISI